MEKQSCSKILLISFSILLIGWPYLHYLANNLKFFDFDLRSFILLAPMILVFGILSFFNIFSTRKYFITSFMTGGILFFMAYPVFSKILRQYWGSLQHYYPQFILGMMVLWIVCSFIFYKLSYRSILVFLGFLNLASIVNLYQELYGGSFSAYQKSYQNIQFKYRPNIYLLITDTYPSLTTLNLLSDFDNKPFHHLQKN